VEATRRRLLDAAFQEIYVHGFHGTSIDKVVAHTGLTKGALFNIFPSKRALGYAVVDEVIADMIRSQWVVPLAGAGDCLETIARSFEAGADALLRMPVHHGCPLNNLAQEMSAIDPGFKARTLRVFDEWISTFRTALEAGQRAGVVRPDADTRDAATMLVTLIEGILSLAKSSQDPEALRAGARNIRTVLATLRAP
jgi:TetR/AcrR family transcriptional repressor of nem operon